MAYFLLTEDAFQFLLEDGSGSVLLEEQPAADTGVCAFLLEDLSGDLLLEDGSGYLIQETCGATTTPTAPAVEYGNLITPRRKPRLRLEDDELLLLILAADA